MRRKTIQEDKQLRIGNEIQFTKKKILPGLISDSIVTQNDFLITKNKNTIKIWDMEVDQILPEISIDNINPLESITCMAITSRFLILESRMEKGGGFFSHLKLYDYSQNRFIKAFDVIQSNEAMSILALTEDKLAAAYRDEKIKIWDLNSFESTKGFGKLKNSKHKNHPVDKNLLQEVSKLYIFSKDILIQSQAGTIKLWNWRTGEMVQTITIHDINYLNSDSKTSHDKKNYSLPLALLPNNECAVGTQTGDIVIVNLLSGQFINTISGHSEVIHSLCVFKNNHLILGYKKSTRAETGWNTNYQNLTRQVTESMTSRNLTRILNYNTSEYIEEFQTNIRFYRQRSNLIGVNGEEILLSNVVVEQKEVKKIEEPTSLIQELPIQATGNVPSQQEEVKKSFATSPFGKRGTFLRQPHSDNITTTNQLATEYSTSTEEDEKWVRCLQTLSDHKAHVGSLIELRDGNIMSGSDDKTAKLWKAESTGEYRCAQTLSHENPRKGGVCLIDLHDGSIFSGCLSKLRLWKVSNRGEYQCMQTLSGHASSVLCLIQLNDKRIASGSIDGTIKLWKLERNGEYRCEQTLKHKGKGMVFCLAELNDGINNRIISGYSDGTIKLWKAKNSGEYAYEFTLNAHENPVVCLMKLQDGNAISGFPDGTIKLLKIDNRGNLRCEQILSGHERGVTCLAQLKDGRILSGSKDKTLKFWKTSKAGEYKCEQTLKIHDYGISCLKILRNNRIMIGFSNGELRLWEIAVKNICHVSHNLRLSIPTYFR